MDHIYERLREAADYLHDLHIPSVSTGLVLGTGLDYIMSSVKVIKEVPYAQIPHFVASTVKSHKGSLIYGTWNGTEILVLAGRNHFYEGHSMQQVTMGIRLLTFLGVQNLIMTNAAGGLNPDYQNGDLVLIKDHINLMPENPLRGNNDPRLGERFPDMSEAYNHTLLQKGFQTLKNLQLPLNAGVYAALPGPNLETPAEYKYLHTIGADLVGMSTVPEVIVAVHSGMQVLALSIVSNECYPPERIKYTTLDSVIETVHAALPKLKTFLDLYLSE
jgi:purine-nucleoside phosphorylase